MIIDKELLALSDIANLCDTSSSNVSNWRKRDKKFPMPFEETSAGPVWRAEDIANYLHQKNEYMITATGNLKTKIISIIGRARGGKSFFNSRFVMDRVGFVKLFCGNGSDKTACPVYVHISDSLFLESFVFHTDFNNIYKNSDSSQIASLREKVNNLVDQSYGQENLSKMHDIENAIKEIRSIENDYPNRKRVNLYIDTYQKPSTFCKDLLRKCGLGSIQIVDTPGVSGKVEVERIAKSDMYIFLIKPDNEDEAQTLKKMVTEVKADVATSKVAFLYKKEGFFLTQKKYEDARKDVKKDMLAFSDLFADLKENIIATELDVLNPANHCILFPTMDEEEITLPEELFLQDIEKKLVNAFLEDNGKEDVEFQTIVHELGDVARKLVVSIMNGIPKHNLTNGTTTYDAENMENENHDRVMTKDNYRLHTDLSNAYDRESTLLDQYFSGMTADQYPEEWQQKIIKYVYKKLTQSVRNDRGLGVGAHPWEERPARTMLIEESIIADRILENIRGKDKWIINYEYKKAFKDSNITSETWNYVGCVDEPDAIIKLEIVKNCLSQVKVSTRENMVLCRYVGGLRKMAQYKLLELMEEDKDAIMDNLKEMPF